MSEIPEFIKNSRFYGSSWISRKAKKIYLLPCEENHELDGFEILFLDDANLEYLNDAFVLDSYKYSPKIAKLYKVTLKKTIRNIDNKIKWQVYRKCEFKCFYCGWDKGELTYDHFVPSSKGGPTTVDNGRASCSLCNQMKGDSDPEDWMQSEDLKRIIKKRELYD